MWAINITSHEDWTMTVEEVQEKDGLLIYVGVRTDNDEPVALKEVFLNNFIKFNKPQDCLFAGQIDWMSRFTLRYEALVNQHQRRRNPTRGLAGGRVSLIRTSSISPTRWVTATLHAYCWPMRWVWARPSKRA